MDPETIEFYLPLGLLWEGKEYRKGHMHLATTLDELTIQKSDNAAVNSRYRDVLLFAQVIDDLEDLKPVTVEMIESLFEADFLFLQLLYHELNNEADNRITVTCPECGGVAPVDVPRLFSDMSLYKQKGAEA
jgi:hypothetical protein